MLSVLSLLVCAATAPTPARNVYVGMYLTDVSDFDLKAGRFKADLRVWVKWMGDGEVPKVLFENGELDQQDELEREEEVGWHSVQWRVRGTFRGEFPVHDFPFDRQTLPLVFALDEDDGRLVPDLGASGMSPSFSVTGWAYEPWFTARSIERRTGSDLGSISREGLNARQRLTVFSVDLQRPFGPYLIKFALPLALIVLMALLALFLPADRLDVRSAMGITALLSCIAFHYTQADTLPDVTYLVAADKLFLGAYIFVAATLLISVIAFRLHGARPRTAESLDRAGTWLLPLLTAVGMASLVVEATSRPAAAKAPAHAARPSQPLLRVAVSALDNLGGGLLPPRRAQLVVRGGDGALLPMLAEEAPAMTNALVRLLPDGGMRVRWRLRDGTRWSDGAALTADDLVFSLGQQPDPLRAAVERVDERTVDVAYVDRRVEWLAGFPVFPRSGAPLAADGGRDALTRANADGRLATAGPWVVSEFEPGRRATFVRNERWAARAPIFDRVEVSVRPPHEAAKALLEGEVDLIPSLTPDTYELLRAAPPDRVRVLEQPGDMLWVLVPKLDRPPWDSLEARRALLQAIDRRALVTALAPAPAQVAWGWRAAAKGTLAPAPTLGALGLAGATVKLNVAAIRSPDEAHALLATRVVEDLTKAGLRVELVERKDHFQVVQRGDYEGLALLARDTAQPGRFMNVSDVTRAAGPWFDDEMAERLERYEASMYDERRRSLEHHMQEAWLLRLPMLPLVLTSRLSAVRAGLEGPTWGNADSLWWNAVDWRFVEGSK